MTQVQAHDGPLHCLAVHDTGSLLCLGRDDGTVDLVAVAEGFVTNPHLRADKAKLVGMFERETRRVKVLDNMVKEARIRASMQTAVSSVKAKSRLALGGFESIRNKLSSKHHRNLDNIIFAAERRLTG